MKTPRGITLVGVTLLFLCSSSLAASRKFDFQDDAGPVEDGFTKVAPQDLYTANGDFGFLSQPAEAVDGSRHSWTVFGRRVRVDDAIPAVVLSDATRDCVIDVGGIEFRVDVPPGEYDITVWLGDVTTPRFQVRVTINGVVIDVDRMDIGYRRGGFDSAIFGSAVPRQIRVSAPDGIIQLDVGPHPEGRDPITWTYIQDEDPKQAPYERTVTLVPAYTVAALQAMVIHPASDPPFKSIDGELVPAAPVSFQPQVLNALGLFNQGRLTEALAAFEQFDETEFRFCKAAGLFWVAGHPALLDDEPALLSRAESLLVEHLMDKPDEYGAADLLLQVRIALEAEHYRQLYGYASGGAPAAENMGRSCSLVEQFQPEHPYYLKGQILWLRNRGGLDPRRVTASWERAQWRARQLDPEWGEANPYVRLYAADEWENGRHWTVIDWKEAAGEGPEWARSLVGNLNVWLDLFEWWSIHRQAPEGDIGGGWTDDVEIVPAFGLMAFVLHGVSDICREAVIRFADGIWDSDIIDQDKGYQRQYADVEHTAEPTGNILHLYPLVRFGDPEGIERLLKSASTFANFFLTEGESSLGHRHFRGNHMSSTEIAKNPDHQADIPLNGRVTAPFNFLVWYSSNPGIEEPLKQWAQSWVEDSLREEHNKPRGVFPSLVWAPTDEIGSPTSGDWWSRQNQFGQFGTFPAYQYYLYNLSAFFYLRTGDRQFLEPFHAVQTYTSDWLRMGRPSLGASPPPGQEHLWAGENLQTVARGPITNLKLGSGLSDWDEYLSRFGTGYSSFLLDPTDVSTINDLAGPVESVMETWPYRTTEGVMTDRILIPGWADVISYYIGADVFSVFFGMPVFAVTWENSTRLFAATVERATQQGLEATTYLFSDYPRAVKMRLWQLELGREYILEAGPTEGPGEPIAAIDQSETFVLEHLGEGVEFLLPARTAYRVRIQQVNTEHSFASPLNLDILPSDLAVRPEDVSYDPERGQIRVRIHNIGASTVANLQVSLFEGTEAEGQLIESQLIEELEAPNDLQPRYIDLEFSYDLQSQSTQVTVVVETSEGVQEVTLENNVASAYIGEGPADRPAPMIIEMSPKAVRPGELVRTMGRHFQPGVQVLESGNPSESVSVRFLDQEYVDLIVPEDAEPSILLISFRNPDGKDSNYLPLKVKSKLDLSHVLYFSQFVNGTYKEISVSSEILLLNRSSKKPANAIVEILDGDGRSLELFLDGLRIEGVAEIGIPARGVRFLKASTWEHLTAGSMTVYSDQPLAGTVVYAGDTGSAGVASSPAFQKGFMSPVERDLPNTVDTGLSVMNLADAPALVELSLFDTQNNLVANAELNLSPRGRAARFVDEFNWQEVERGLLGLGNFAGVLRASCSVKITGSALQTRDGEFATLPVTDMLAVPTGTPDSLMQLSSQEDANKVLHFAHFADGQESGFLITTEILLMNRNPDVAAEAILALRDQNGGWLETMIDGQKITGEKSVTIPEGGLSLLRTSGEG